MVDSVIVGAGFAGAVLAERLASSGKRVLIVEKRDHIGGNCYDHYDEAGILIHEYGPHIFHTENKEVWDYLSRFTEWIPYRHRVLANIEGRNVTLPPNLDTIYELFSRNQAQTLERKLLDSFGQGAKVPVLELRKSKDRDLKSLAEEVYNKIFLNYTQKQWGMSPEELDPQVTGRVPIWVDRDNRYFKDRYQGIPKNGYTKTIEKMLDHPNIEVRLNKDYKDIIDQIDYTKLVYTGAIDYFFDYKYGSLPYRSLRFEFETLDKEKFQGAAVINYPGAEAFTRITEFKHFTGQKNPKTTILREYPEEFQPRENIPCYPIPKKENYDRYLKYRGEATKLENVVFIGRLAEYCYYNMDKVIERALRVFEDISVGRIERGSAK